MKITNPGVANTSLPSQQQIDGAAAAAGDPSAPSVTTAAHAYTPSSELVHLINLVRQQPEVREERVQAAAQRLQEGYYQTQASAEHTATALLTPLD
jgi:hypothetical protein